MCLGAAAIQPPTITIYDFREHYTTMTDDGGDGDDDDRNPKPYKANRKHLDFNLTHLTKPEIQSATKSVESI